MTEAPILIFDTSALKNIGESIESKNFKKLLLCSINGHIKLFVPYAVINELASQRVEKKIYLVRRSDLPEPEKQEEVDRLNRTLSKEEKKLKLLIEKNGGTVLDTEGADRINALKRLEAKTYDCEIKKDKDRRDFIIYEVAVRLAKSNPDQKIVFAVSDGGPTEIVNEYNDENGNASSIQVMKGRKIPNKLLNGFSDFPLGLEDVTEEDLQPIDALQFGNEEEEPPPSLRNFDIEAAQDEMADRFRLSQKCLIAASHLMFPATDKDAVAEKLKQAWGIEIPETQGAASFLMNEGYLEDLYGDYSVVNEDFAEQAIYALGEDINRLIEVLD